MERKTADWAITSANSGELLGSIGLTFNAAHDHAEMGYWIALPHWGSGFCTEAARAVLAYAFDHRNLARVCAHHFGSNPASGRVMQKIGMKYEGTSRRHLKKWDRFEDAVWYGILRDEYQARTR
jgi:RimJ/RimL family protein N-acetyltransferase